MTETISTSDIEKPPMLVMDSERSQFGLRSLFIAVTVFAILLGLFRAFGIFGALFSFIAAVIATYVIVAQRIESRGFLFAFIWAVCMPIVCLAFDPFIFFDFRDSLLFGDDGENAWKPSLRLSQTGVYAVPAILLQITAMLTWLMFGSHLRRGAHAFVGVFAIGMVVSLAIGICMIPLTLIGTLMLGIGLMGLTPFFTASAYFHSMKDALAKSKQCEFKRPYTGRILIVAGGVFSVLLSVGISLVLDFLL